MFAMVELAERVSGVGLIEMGVLYSQECAVAQTPCCVLLRPAMHLDLDLFLFWFRAGLGVCA